MSKVETTEVAARYVPAGNIARYATVLDKELTVNTDHNLESGEALDEKLLEGSGMDLATYTKAQEIGADISAALLYVGSKKSIGHISENRDVQRVAGKVKLGRNELAYSFQSMAKESNADGSPKNPVVSVIHRQYEADDYREIRKDVMLHAQSLRD